MTLHEIINHIDSFDDNGTIYSKRSWKLDSDAIVTTEPDEGGIPDEAEEINAEYFLEIFLAKEFLEDHLANLQQGASEQEQYLRLIQYAESDA